MNPHIIEVTHLTKKFGDFVAVDNINLNVKRGEIFAFLGPNGAGKTTTIKMLTTLMRQTDGSILFDGHDTLKHPNEIRKSFGIVFQDPSLDNELTAYENMQFHAVLYGVPRHVYKERIQTLLTLVELDTRQHDAVKHFSGGMKRRLEIARGLLHHPKVLFLDEPTLGLDPQTRNVIWNYIKELNQKEGVTIFFTTHHMEEVDRVGQRIAIIDHGTILIEGTPEELRQKTGKPTLEEAFIALTGSAVRKEQGNAARDRMKIGARLWR